MPNITASIRFTSRPLSRPFRLQAGSSVDAVLEFVDDQGEPVAVTGASLRATQPDGSAYDWTEGTFTAVSTGVYRRTLTPPAGLVGNWLVEGECTGPQPETAAAYLQLVTGTAVQNEISEPNPPIWYQRALTAAEDAEAAADRAAVSAGGAVVWFATRSAARDAAGDASIPETASVVRTEGYAAAGDGGDAAYVWADALPAWSADDPDDRLSFADASDRGGYWILAEETPSVLAAGAVGVQPHPTRAEHIWPTEVANDVLPALVALDAYLAARGGGVIRVPYLQFWLSDGWVGSEGVGIVGDLSPPMAENNDDFARMGCAFFHPELDPAIHLNQPPEARNIALIHNLKVNIVAKRWIESISRSGTTVTCDTTAEHNFAVGTSAVVAGTGQYDGTHTVTSVPQVNNQFRRFTFEYASGSGTVTTGTVIGTTEKGITTISAAVPAGPEPLGFEESRQYADAFAGRGWLFEPADFARLENLRSYNADTGCTVRQAKGVVINAIEGDARSLGFGIYDLGQGGLIDRVFFKPRLNFGCETFSIPIASMSEVASNGRIRVTLTVPVFYDSGAQNSNLRMRGVTASNGYVITGNWRVVTVDGDPYSLDLVGSVYADGAPFDYSSGRGIIQPFSTKYRVGATTFADNGSGGLRITTAWPHCVGNNRRFTMPADLAYGTEAALALLEEQEYRTEVIDSTTIDVLDMNGDPVPWDADYADLDEACVYFFGAMREGTGLYYDNIDASRVFNCFAWGFTTGHDVNTGMVNYVNCGRGEEGTYRGPNSVGTRFREGCNGIRWFGGEIANAGLPILMEARQNVTFEACEIAPGASGVSIRQTNGTLIMAASPIDGTRGTSRSVISLGDRMVELRFIGKAGTLTGIITDSGAENRVRRVKGIAPDVSSGANQTLYGPVDLTRAGGALPARFTMLSDDADDVDQSSSLIISGDRTLNPNMPVVIGASGGSATYQAVTLRRQGVLHAGDQIGELSFAARQTSGRIDTATRASGTATLAFTFPCAFHVGDSITVAGADSFDGTFTVTAATSTSVSYTQAGSDEVLEPVGATVVLATVSGEVYVTLKAYADDPVAGTENGRLDVVLTVDSSQTVVASFGPNGLTGDGRLQSRMRQLTVSSGTQALTYASHQDYHIILRGTGGISFNAATQAAGFAFTLHNRQATDWTISGITGASAILDTTGATPTAVAAGGVVSVIVQPDASTGVEVLIAGNTV